MLPRVFWLGRLCTFQSNGYSSFECKTQVSFVPNKLFTNKRTIAINSWSLGNPDQTLPVVVTGF